MTVLDTRPTAEAAGAPVDPVSPRWPRYALNGLLGLTAILYLWGLSASGWANAFYSAAAQAGADNWTAFLFGSSDMANSITVDKPPASIWVMAASVKLFGLSSWSLLIPQALMGVGTVAVLYLAVRRWYGPIAGLIAATAMAFTPVAVLLFRFNNPDALLVLLLVAAAYATVRATEAASVRWIALAGVLIGFAFLTKSLQAFLVLPAFALMYVVAAPTGIGKRIRDLLIAFAAMVVAGGWWVALAELWPTDSRPYIGGSQTNSVIDLIIGYNGLGRLTGEEVGSVVPGGRNDGPGGNGDGMWGETSWHRMFDGSWAGGIAWLLPAALVLALAGFWFTRSQGRTATQRAGLILWFGWLFITWATFSFGSGIIHEYYAVALAPAIAALVGIGSALLWQRRSELAPRIVLTVVIAGSGWYAASLLQRAGSPYSTVGLIVAVAACAAACLLVVDASPRITQAAAITAAAALLAGPLMFSVQTAATAHTGSLPAAGPTLSGGSGRGGPGGGLGGPGGRMPGTAPPVGMTPPTGTPPGAGPAAMGGGMGGGPGGLLDAATPSTELSAVLTEDASQYRWIAATTGSQNASGYQLATGYSVMPIGGFNGSDPSPTLDQFRQWVADGEIHWYLGGGSRGPGGMGGPGGSSGTSGQISEWVAANFESTTVAGVTLYDLTARDNRTNG